MQTWVSQPNHAQPRQVALKMKNNWEPLLPPLTWVVRKPSRYEVDSPLLKAIRASHIIVSACDTVTFPGDCMLLFIAMPMGLGHGRDDKGKKVHKYIYVQNTAKLLQIREHALSLNIQMSTNIHAWFEFRQPSDLIRGFGEGSILSYGTIQEAESFFGKIYGSIPAARHVCKRHVNRKASNYQRCSIFTARSLTTRFQSCDKSTCSI